MLGYGINSAILSIKIYNTDILIEHKANGLKYRFYRSRAWAKITFKAQYLVQVIQQKSAVINPNPSLMLQALLCPTQKTDWEL